MMYECVEVLMLKMCRIRWHIYICLQVTSVPWLKHWFCELNRMAKRSVPTKSVRCECVTCPYCPAHIPCSQNPRENQKNHKNQKPSGKTIAKPLRKTKKNKKTKDLSNYGDVLGPLPATIVAQIFVFFGIFGFSRWFCYGFA